MTSWHPCVFDNLPAGRLVSQGLHLPFNWQLEVWSIVTLRVPGLELCIFGGGFHDFTPHPHSSESLLMTFYWLWAPKVEMWSDVKQILSGPAACLLPSSPWLFPGLSLWVPALAAHTWHLILTPKFWDHPGLKEKVNSKETWMGHSSLWMVPTAFWPTLLLPRPG